MDSQRRQANDHNSRHNRSDVQVNHVDGTTVASCDDKGPPQCPMSGSRWPPHVQLASCSLCATSASARQSTFLQGLHSSDHRGCIAGTQLDAWAAI